MSNTSALTFASGLDYALTSGAPPIHRDDIAAWKSRVSPDVTHHFVERQEELKQEYEVLRAKYQTLLEKYEQNRLVYNSEINFTPVVGQTYYLYELRGKRFLSLVAPRHSGWEPCLGAFRLNTSYVWETVTEV